MVSELGVHPVFSLSKMTLLRTILAYFLSLGASRGTLLSIQFAFLLAPISCRIDHAVSLWSSLCQPWLPRQEFCLGRKLSLSSCDGWLSQSLSYLGFRSLSGVLLQLVRCLEGSEVVAGLAVLQNVPSISSLLINNITFNI